MNKLGSTQAPDAAYQVSRSLAFWFQRRSFFCGFYHIWAWWPSWSCDQDHLNKLSLPHPIEAPYEIRLIGPVVSEGKMFKECGQQMTTTMEAYLSYKITFGSDELKSLTEWLQFSWVGFYTLQNYFTHRLSWYRRKDESRREAWSASEQDDFPGSDFLPFFMCFFMYNYSPRQGQTTQWGQKIYDNRKAFSLCPYVASFKTISSKSDFIHIFNDFIHVYSPGSWAPLMTNFWCQQKALITLTICCKFKQISFNSDFINIF